MVEYGRRLDVYKSPLWKRLSGSQSEEVADIGLLPPTRVFVPRETDGIEYGVYDKGPGDGDVNCQQDLYKGP